MTTRSPMSPEEYEIQRARLMVEQFGGRRRSQPRTNGAFTTSAMAKAERAVREMMNTGDWDQATPRHFVALYALMHEHVYNVAPDDMTTEDRKHAAMMAGKMLKDQFDSNTDAMAAFFEWTWRREREREKWRRENQRDGGHIGWRLMFNCKLLTDYRLHLARKGAKLS